MTSPEPTNASEQPGAQIGRYKLLEPIGEGGFGSVWMAEQREPVKRRVALKIIKLGMDTRQVIARFEAERQALAMMDHPNIAKVLDAGATETGRPFFVMELVKGVPILEYCDKARLDTKGRLELFTSVCHAIQHAHQKGIIHRDIKPSNVLVTLHDGVAVPKVIDFGIAKATHSELTAKTLFTEHQQMIGTPAYMSPEQAELSGLDIDTRSDIYSLGVLLYELLTGTTPFDVRELLSKGLAEMMRVIREVEPHKPSTRISTLGDTAVRTAELRHIDVKKLGATLRGDLDWIVMKCLEKDRSRRYETANGLAADIQRHLNDEPVTAGAPSASYRLRKFVKRHRGQVIAGGAVVAALLIGVVAFAWQAEVARDQRDLAVRAKDSEAEQRQLADAARAEAQAQQARAEAQEAEARKQEAEARAQEAEAKKQAAIAEAVAKFQTDMLAAADPQKLLGDKVTVVQAMEAAVRELDQGSLEDQPLVEARVRATIGTTLQSLARYDDAEPNLRKSVAILRAERPAGHPDIANGLSNLASLLQAQNKLSEAEPLFREALEVLRAALPAGHPDIAVGLSNLATLLCAQNRLSEAEPLYREALKMLRAALPAGHPDIALGLSNLATLLCTQNRLSEAEPLYREVLEMLRAALPAGHPDIAFALHNLALLLQDQNNHAEAEPLVREALAIRRTALPAGHPDIALILDNLASLLLAQNKLAEAELLAREALEVFRAAFPAGHPSIAQGMNNLASLLLAQNKLAEAEPLYREALMIWRAALPAGHPEVATGLNNLASLLLAQNKLAEAEPLYREVVEIRRAAIPAGHPDRLASEWELADIYVKLQKTDQAMPLIRERLDSDRATLPKDSPELAGQLVALGLALLKLEAWDEAEPLIREALAIREAKEPEDWRTFNTKSMLGGALLSKKRLAEAEPLLLDGYRGMEERAASIPPEGRPRILEALERLVQLYEAQDNVIEAATWRKELDAARLRDSDPATDGNK